MLLFRVFTVLSNFGISMLIARMFAPERVGEYFLLFSVVSVATSFSLFGVNIAIVRIVASAMAKDKSDDARSAIHKAHIVGAITSLVMASFLYFFGIDILSHYVFKTSDLYDYRLLVAIWIVLWSLNNLNADILLGFKQFHLSALVRRFSPNLVILSVAFYLFVSSINITLNDYLGIVLFAWLISIIMSSMILYRYFLKGSKEGGICFNELLSMSMPLWITGGVTFALPQMDLWILAVFESPEALALYGAASRVIRLVGMPLLIAQTVVPSLIAESYDKHDKKDLARGLQTVAAMSFIPGAFLCLLFLTLGDTILEFVFGGYYVDALPVLQIMTVGMFIKLFAGSSQPLLTMTGHGKITMIVSISSSVLMIAGCLLVGEKYGMRGIATVSTITIGLHFTAVLLLARRLTGIWAFPMLRVAQVRRIIGKFK